MGVALCRIISEIRRSVGTLFPMRGFPFECCNGSLAQITRMMPYQTVNKVWQCVHLIRRSTGFGWTDEWTELIKQCCSVHACKLTCDKKPMRSVGYTIHTPGISAPCGLRGCKNGPTPFPGRMSYKATKPGLVSVLYLSIHYMVSLFIRAPFYVLLVFIAMCGVFWLFWLSYQYLPSDWLERLVCVPILLCFLGQLSHLPYSSWR